MINFPSAFEARMRHSLQGEWEAFSRAHAQESPVAFRVNPGKNKIPGLPAVPWTTLGTYLDQRPVFTLDPALHAGAYYVQEASSMFLEQAVRQSVDLTKPLRVLDLCAAPGGKSTHLLSLLSPASLLVSNEVIHGRATVLSENIQKWGYPNVVVSNNDPKDFQRLSGFFDLVVIDAPCSGEGLFRKDPDAMKEWSPEHADLCAMRQRRILTDVWPSLKENAVLIYCTCTYHEKENEENLIWLGQQVGMESIRLNTESSWGVREVEQGNVVGYHFLPHRVRGEGFFISVLRKQNEEIPARTKTKFTFNSPSAKVGERLMNWMKEGAGLEFITQQDLALAIPSSAASEIAWLSERLKIITKGTAVATLKHEKLVPEHAAAISIMLNTEHFSQENVNLDQALAYLRKDTLLLGEGKRGFALIVYEKLPLGWVNLLGNRMNNLYPSSWRIRMGS
jgi:16S rRNA C967 or C1407 C5-methylase (RsmB/RsmF family)/NOL1/NOP2/fmu family ribosome biogenesis protein